MLACLLWATVVLILGGLGALVWAVAHTPYLAHPLGYCTGTRAVVKECRGYNFWSGLGSDLGEVSVLAGLLSVGVAVYRHTRCHHDGCRKFGRFPHGHLRLCHTHHPLTPNDGRITAAHIAAVGKDQP